MEIEEIFQITIKILRAKDLNLPNMDSRVVLTIDKIRKKTVIQRKNNSPHYNEFFVFEFRCTKQQFLDKLITIAVWQPRTCCRKKKCLGQAQLDVGTVWVQPDRQFYHKWVVLINKKGDDIGAQGYVLCDIAVLTSFDEEKRFPVRNLDEEDLDIEGNLLIPVGIETSRQQAIYHITIFRADIIPNPNDVNFKCCISKCCEAVRERVSEPLLLYIEIALAGMKAHTTMSKETWRPVWNEKISFLDMFPPFWQRIRIRLRSYSNCCQNNNPVLGIYYLDLKTVSDSHLNGYVPTFGPGHIYLMSGSYYRGQLLWELSTELELEDISQEGQVQHSRVKSLPEKQFWQERPVMLAAALFEVSMIPTYFKDAYFNVEMNLGGIGNSYLDSNSSLNKQTSPPLRAQKPFDGNSSLLHLPIGTQIPCIFLHEILPDHTHRIHRSNLLDSIYQYLKEELDALNNLLDTDMDQNSNEVTEKSNSIVQNFIKACDHYLKLAKDLWTPQLSMMPTNLDRERHKMIQREILQMKYRVSQVKNSTPEEIYQILYEIQEDLAFLIEDPQPPLPDIFLWLQSGLDKIYASIQLKARDFWSDTPVAPVECSGKLAGKMHTLLLNTVFKTQCVKLVIYIWLGPSWEAENKWSLGLPNGFRYSSPVTPELPIPSSIIYEEFHLYQCRAHIFQGKYPIGGDTSGLSDAFVRIHIAGQSKQTRVCHQTLSPFWDECIIFDKITLFGPSEEIKANPPNIVIEAWDRDIFAKSDLQGVALCKPKVKLAKEIYSPPNLKWYILDFEENRNGEILAAFELMEIYEDELIKDCEKFTFDSKRKLMVPDDIRPIMASFRLEVYFWGVRGLKLDLCACLRRPCVAIEIGECILESEKRQKSDLRGKAARRTFNFVNPRQQIDLILPVDLNIHPAILIRVFDRCGFGRRNLLGSRLLEGLASQSTKIISRDRWLEQRRIKLRFQLIDLVLQRKKEKQEKIRNQRRSNKRISKFRRWLTSWTLLSESESDMSDSEETLDWWSKYYRSKEMDTIENVTIEKSDKVITVLNMKKSIPWITIYSNELERQSEFKGFKDIIRTFPVSRGKDRNSKKNYGLFKGSLHLYPWPPFDGNEKEWVYTRNGRDVSEGLLQYWPGNKSDMNFIARVFIVRAYDLHPRDSSGRSDPYIELVTPTVHINDHENYLEKQTDPIFGRYFEMQLSFPTDYLLTVRVMDHDIIGKDDLIGETKIDLEMRYFTKHRAATPIQHVYNKRGYNVWRGIWRPSQILRHLCKEARIPGPIYTSDGVLLGDWEEVNKENNNIHLTIHNEEPNEQDALLALHHWYLVPGCGCPLVPEHVETRSLYHPDKPGLVQGRLEMWVEILRPGERHVPPPVELAPREPQDFELRVIIWNTRDVVLQEHDIFLGTQVSDIYVKGWLGDIKGAQTTDIHYRSLTGEGNFNWRMKFPCRYLATENCLILNEQKGFARLTSQIKVPAQLTLQIYDNDLFSQDDFLGSVILDLARMPRGAKSANKCILTENVRYLNLIHVRRTRGWWAAKRKVVDGNYELTGKIEMEFELLTKEEAEENPAGYGRKEPEALPKPNRPDTSFTWFRNPWKALKYTIKAHCFKVCCYCAIVVFPTIFFILFFYAFPGYTAKRILGV